MESVMTRYALATLLIATLMLFEGCSPVQQDTLAPKLESHGLKRHMYVTKTYEPFRQGDRVTILDIEPPYAITERGKIPVSMLAERPVAQRIDKMTSTKSLPDEVTLKVNAPDGARVRILNIRPKFRDGIALKRGRYHIEVSKPGYRTYKRWHKLNDHTTLEIALKKIELQANGHILWKTPDIHFSFQEWGALAWYRGNGKQMNWQDAKRYCRDLSIESNGIVLEDFRLPGKEEVRSYASRNRIKPAPVWTSSTDTKHAYAMYGREAKNTSKSASYPYVRCVTGKVDYNALTLTSIANRLYEREYQRRSTLNLPKKPKKEPYPKLTQGEFERTATFKARVAAANAAVDERYATATAKWKQKVAAKKHKYRQDLKYLEKAQQYNYLRAYEKAFHVKYGAPRISRAAYNRDGEYILVTVTSERGGFEESVTIPVERNYARKFQTMLTDKAFTPDVELEVINSAVKVIGIAQIKDPKTMVEKNEYEKAYNSIGRLKGFIRKYPDSVYASQARSRIKQLSNSQ